MTLPRRFLCVITDEHRCPVELARMALEGGARMLQLRRKHASGRELFAWAIRIQELCRQHEAIFVVNDRLDIAMAMHADGVHLGQEDLPAATARALLGPEILLGVSVSNVEEAVKAHAEGADYLGLGHIFPTVSKEKPNPPLGIPMIESVRKAVDLPIVAIGGIGTDNAAEVMKAGASGLAVISAVASAGDPTAAARELVRRIWL
ncbi:MAG: thiamine phosphate synthase [Chlorobiaceae bacterium]|nr:thiamine phosphate synthase [Chlorobiaceae bacterium]